MTDTIELATVAVLAMLFAALLLYGVGDALALLAIVALPYYGLTKALDREKPT